MLNNLVHRDSLSVQTDIVNQEAEDEQAEKVTGYSQHNLYSDIYTETKVVIILSLSGPPIKSEDRPDRTIQYFFLDSPIKSGNDVVDL